MRRQGGLWLMVLGLLLLCAALGLMIYNIQEDKRAGEDAQRVLRRLTEEDDSLQEEEEGSRLPDYVLDPQMEMPTKEVDGLLYIGTLEIPSLALVLPVISEWSYPNLRIAPCRYTGSAYSGDLVIAAHNYNQHFGQIKTLESESEVRFTDVKDHVFVYQVEVIDILSPTAVEEMTSGDWDLTLFTCTLGGQTRVTVRCRRVYPEN